MTVPTLGLLQLLREKKKPRPTSVLYLYSMHESRVDTSLVTSRRRHRGASWVEWKWSFLEDAPSVLSRKRRRLQEAGVEGALPWQPRPALSGGFRGSSGAGLRVRFSCVLESGDPEDLAK